MIQDGIETTLQRAERENRELEDRIRTFHSTVSEIDKKISNLRELVGRFDECMHALIPDTLTDHIAQSGHHTTRHGASLNLPKQYEITVTINPTIETTDTNLQVIRDSRRLHSLLKGKWTRRLHRWTRTLSSVLAPLVEESQHRIYSKLVSDFLSDVTGLVERFEMLRFEDRLHTKLQTSNWAYEEDEFDDEDFEEVEVTMLGCVERADTVNESDSTVNPSLVDEIPAASMTPVIAPQEKGKRRADSTPVEDSARKMPSPAGPKPMTAVETKVVSDDPVRARTYNSYLFECSNSTQELICISELLATAPIVHWDTDLNYWDASSLKFHNFSSGIERSHRFLGSSDGSNQISQSTMDGLRKRVVNLEQTPIEELAADLRECRAPLRNGALCKRMDLVNCPFHGRIVARDDEGQYVREEDRILVEGVQERDIFAPADGKTFVMDLLIDKSSFADLAKRGAAAAVSGSASGSASATATMSASASGSRRNIKQDSPSKRFVKKRIEGLEVNESSKLVDLRTISDDSRSRLSKKVADRSRSKRIREADGYDANLRFRDKKA